MPKKDIDHVVVRHGRTVNDKEVSIPVATDLTTVPGIPTRESDVSFYSTNYPLETHNIEKTADRDWIWTVYDEKLYKYLERHDELVDPLIEASEGSAELEPISIPEKRVDVTNQIREKARNLGFGEVGFTRFDYHYAFLAKKSWVQYEHVICLAIEQDYIMTQSAPSLQAEQAHYGAYELEGALLLDLAEYIRGLGYHAQVHSPNDNSSVFIPMFVAAGLGQLGANGQLLSPHFGSRSRLALLTTDAPLTHDDPVDYGINNFCKECQICVNRCPGRALVREKVWWRGVEKFKVIYDRCRPIMGRYSGCAICIKTCPIQRYGMKPVMEYYVETGEVLGKGTENLEGYDFIEKGHFSPGQLPAFDRDTFQIPKGTNEDWLFEEFKTKLKSGQKISQEYATKFADSVKEVLEKGKITRD